MVCFIGVLCESGLGPLKRTGLQVMVVVVRRAKRRVGLRFACLARQPQRSLWRFVRLRNALFPAVPISAPPVASHTAALSSPRVLLRRT